MPVETQKDIVSALQWRYAAKKFDSSKKIDDATWSRLEESLMLSPSSFGLQPWKFVVITDQSIKAQLPAISWNQQQPADCSHLVVLCTLDEMTPAYVEKWVEYNAAAKNVSLESMKVHKDMMLNFVTSQPKAEIDNWMARQVYIALGTLLTAAATLGVDACPMEGLDRAAYDKLLGLPEKGCRAQVMCPLGYRADDDKYGKLAKVRFSKSDVVIHV